MGIDQFDFDITTGVIVPNTYGEVASNEGTIELVPQNVEDNFYGATLWIITHGNMDYLKVDEDGKCPKSDKGLSWSNPSCR